MAIYKTITNIYHRHSEFTLYYIIFIGLVLFYYHYHSVIPISSDTTTNLPMSYDMVKGNLLLSDWILGSNGFYFTENVVYYLGLLLGGSYPFLIFFIPSLAYAILVTVTLYLYNQFILNTDKRTKLMHDLFIIIVLAFVPVPSTYTLLNANSHNNLYAFLIIDILFILRLIYTNKFKYYLGFLILSLMMTFSEGVTEMVLYAPVGCFCILYYFKNRKNKWGPLLLAGCGITYITGKILLLVVVKLGGFYIRGFPVHLVDFHLFFMRLKEWVLQAGVLFGLSNFSFSNIGTVEVFYKIFMIFLMISWIISLVINTVRINKIGEAEKLFCCIAVINLLCCLFSDVTVFHRYLVPAYFFGLILTFKTLSVVILSFNNMVLKKTCIIMCVVFCVCICTFRMETIFQKDVYGNTQIQVINLIRQKGYGHGYGSYWAASQLSYYSNFMIDIYPILVHSTDGIEPYPELIKREWYKERDKHFIVVDTPGFEKFIDIDKLFIILGPPQDMFSYGEYAVYYWDKDISQYLINLLPLYSR